VLPGGITLADWEALPDRAESIVVSGGSRIYVLDDGVARERMMSDSSGAGFFEFGTNPNVVYANGSSLSGGRRFRVLAIDEEGIQEVAWNEGLPSTLGDIEFSGGLLYSTSGRVLGTNGAILGQVSGLGSSNLVESAVEQHALAYLTKIGTNWQVRVYDPVTLGLIGSLSVSNVVGTPRALVRWGEDGLAFCTSSNQIVLLRTQLMRPQADVSVEYRQAAASSVLAGQAGEWILTVSNSGPLASLNTLLTNIVSSGITVTAAQATQGNCSVASNNVVCNLGTLASNASASVTIRFMATNSTSAIFSNFCQVSTSLIDVVPTNDVAWLVFESQADNDRDGMADHWELANGLDPGNSVDAGGDLDSDGHSNLDEYRAGTNPRDAENVFRVHSLQLVDNSLELRFHSVAGRTYSIEEKDNLRTGMWTPRLSAIQASNEFTTVNITVSPSAPLRLYRVRLSN
jgi:uncharacterized repeat protein (TIGR01451 family)